MWRAVAELLVRLPAATLARAALMLRQPLPAFCDLETIDGDALIDQHLSYVSFIRVRGMNRIVLRADVERIAEALRIDLSGLFEQPGHALQAWYACDPHLSGPEIDHHLASPRSVARQIGLDLADIFAERERVWPRIMRAEDCYFVLWSKKSLLTKEEDRQAERKRNAQIDGLPDFGDGQKPFLATETLAGQHRAFVQRVVSSLRLHGVALDVQSPAEAIRVARIAVYPETAGEAWAPLLPSSKPMPRLPESDRDVAALLPPSIAYQLFHRDARTEGGQRVVLGEHEWSSVDMSVGPEDPRPFVELIAKLARDHIPWRVSMLVESDGRRAMMLKQIAATLLGIVPGNRQVFEAFEALRKLQHDNHDTIVKLRVSCATWAPQGDTDKLQRQVAALSQRVQGWGNCRTNTIAGDPLEGLMSSALGLSTASTAPPAAAQLSQVLQMLPWSRQASPWETGAVLFRTPDGRIWPFDPAGSKRMMVCDIFVAPPGFGKSVLANTINLGLCLSSAAQVGTGTKLPLIGKLDIGPSAEGFISLLQEALPPERRGEAVYVPFQFIPAHAFNVFDLQVGCRQPLPLERAFLQNFLSLASMPIDSETPFESMDQMVSFVIDEAYRMLGDSGPNTRPKRYQAGVEPAVDAAVARLGVALEAEAWWWEVVDALCHAGLYHLAGLAQRHAVPVMEDLITAARSRQVQDTFGKVLAETRETAIELFVRYVKAFVRKYPTLNMPTRLDFGPARVIVLDLQAVAPTGSAEADRQTELMYLLGRHVLARNFFLHPEYSQHVPEPVRAYHAQRFSEIRETVKRLDYDEFHRTRRCRYTRDQVDLDRREGRKHNTQIAITSQIAADLGEDMISQSTGRFILGAGDQREMEQIIARFQLTDAAAEIVRHRLKGPDREGGGAPFLAVLDADNVRHEQMVVNSLGPVELWALSTTPLDVALRTRLYERLGPVEARRRLARVFATGSAEKEITRRKAERMRRGDEEARAERGVIDEIAAELVDGTGLAIGLRKMDASEPTSFAPERRMLPL